MVDEERLQERQRSRVPVTELIETYDLGEFVERARATNGENAEPEDGDQTA